MSTAGPIPAPLSRNVEVAMYVSGALCLIGGVAAIANLADQTVSGPVQAPMSRIYWIAAPFFIGGPLLRTPAGRRRDRAERLAQLRSSSTLDDAAQIQVQQRTPDLVYIANLCGVLSLITLSVVFGPVGIACGIAAAMQGHWKGLIGIILGLAGLAWTVFLMAQVIGN